MLHDELCFANEYPSTESIARLAVSDSEKDVKHTASATLQTLWLTSLSSEPHQAVHPYSDLEGQRCSNSRQNGTSRVQEAARVPQRHVHKVSSGQCSKDALPRHPITTRTAGGYRIRIGTAVVEMGNGARTEAHAQIIALVIQCNMH